jgi:hypothetical protein
MAIEEVTDWEIVPRENSSPHPTGPTGATAGRISRTFQEMQAAIARWRDSEVGGGGLITGKFKFDSSTSTAPGSTKVRFDTGAYNTVTELFISDTTSEGGDATNFLAGLAADDQVYIQNTGDASIFSVWTVSGAVTDEGNWFRIPVTERVSGVFPSNNHKMTVALNYN